ncbi:ATP-binding protein [bacterium]|nr:ATP-binding protein [bacterium]
MSRILSLVLAAFLSSTESGFSQEESLSNPALVQLTQGWQYRWGGSPFDSAGVPLWAYESWESSGWREAPTLNNPPGRDQFNHLWLRVRLPRGNWFDPTLFIPAAVNSFEVYLGRELIHQIGEFTPSNRAKYAAAISHMVPLNGRDFSGKVVAIRMYSQVTQFAGIIDVYQKVQLGSRGEILRQIFRKYIDSFLLGVLFIVFGLFAVFVFLRRFKQKVFLPVSFGAFTVFMGLFYATSYPIGQVFIESVVLKYYVAFISYSLFPIGLYAFFEQIVGPTKIVRSLWQLHLAYALTAVALDLMNIVIFPVSQFYYNIGLIATILIAFVIGIRAALKGNVEARIFVAGFSLLGLLGVYDLLVSFELFPFWHGLSHWGTLLFVLTLGYILERRFTENHSRLQRYSKELEAKSDQLQDYSQTLEEKVQQRTADLNDKNVQLEQTLTELRDTQEQLFMKEKMASLGNLVAGVAHEVNNPIGAIHSAADTTGRGIAKIKSLAESDGLSQKSGFQKTLKLLEENSGVINMATQRVSNIVKSLKNFARLDEADYQDSDIHVGLDSTLTLIRHELKGRIQVEKYYGEIPQLKCYPNQLNQVFMNVLMNAVHAIQDRGTITITTTYEDNKIKIQIADSGEGMSVERMEKIFDPGFTTKDAGVGTGLGLSISYNIIQKHNGNIEVESEVGKGTRFTIVMPINRD